MLTTQGEVLLKNISKKTYFFRFCIKIANFHHLILQIRKKFVTLNFER